MKTVTFQSSYRGVTTGVSNWQDAWRKLGIPLWKFLLNPFRVRLFWYEPHLRHNDVSVFFSKHDGKLQTLRIYERGFIDKNGVVVGGPWSQVEKIPDISLVGFTAVDNRGGVAYRDAKNDGMVDHVIYLRELRVDS